MKMPKNLDFCLKSGAKYYVKLHFLHSSGANLSNFAYFCLFSTNSFKLFFSFNIAFCLKMQ